MENFDDIRPFQDSEVNDVIERLLTDKEFFSAIAGFQLPRLKKTMPAFANSLVKKSLRKKMLDIQSVTEVQKAVNKYLEKIIETTSSNLTISGLEQLSTDSSYLFISNHRDIVMDPALVGYLLNKAGHDTAQIAIGDNLLKKAYVSDLMRLNKSFIVKRSVQGREKLLASQQLSKYIRYAISEKNNVWIAQREGRAKNGIDKTDAAILKMLHMANRDAEQKLSLKESINSLRIVPVSISYEYDPCAEMKSRELFEVEKNGSFEKNEESDVISISTGMNGEKGNIHVSFGTMIDAVNDDPTDVALQIDRQIVGNYQLHASNYLAYEKLQAQEPSIGQPLSDEISIPNNKRLEFEEIYQEIPTELKPYFLRMYANPIVNKVRLEQE